MYNTLVISVDGFALNAHVFTFVDDLSVLNVITCTYYYALYLMLMPCFKCINMNILCFIFQ